MQQAQPNPQWQHPSINATAIQQPWNYGPATPPIVPQQVPTPVARKQVPSRRPVGQAVSPQENLARQDSTSTSRQSVSSISSLPSLSGSVTGPQNRSVVSQPSFQSPPPIIKQLPVGWIICNDANGRTYFFNTTTNHSSWEPPESEVIIPNYGLPPTFTPVTYAPVPIPQSFPVSQPTIQSTNAGVAFSPMNLAPQFSQIPTAITPQQQQISPTTFLSQSPATFTTQPQAISPTNSFSSQSKPFSQPSDLQWETYPDNQPSRRKSLFSMPKGFTAPKIDTTSVRNGAKIAGQTGLKGAKIAGKALKNNRKVIGAGVKIANVVLKETTGVTIPGSNLIAGDSDDDDGVLGAIGAVGSMIGAGVGNDCGVLVDANESYTVEVEVDQITIDNDGTVEVECEEVDIYQTQESVEGVGSVHYQEQTIQAAVMSHVQQPAKRPHNRRKQLANDPQRQGQPISVQGSKTTLPARDQKVQPSNKSTSGRKPLQTSQVQRPSIYTPQLQPGEIQIQRTSNTRHAQVAGATENMEATLRDVSNLAKSFSGIFRDDAVEGSSYEYSEDYNKTQDGVECVEQNEQYSIETVDVEIKYQGGVSDYSTLDGSGAFCGEQGRFAINEVEPAIMEGITYNENTQSSQIVQQKSYTVETVEITNSYQQEANFENVDLVQDTQVSDAFEQETTTEVYTTENFEIADTVEEIRGNSTNTQEEFHPTFQNTNQTDIDSWSSTSPTRQNPWSQENLMLEENVWATEPANVPSMQETTAWTDRENCVFEETAHQSTSQLAPYSETIFVEETAVQNTDTGAYTESNTIVSRESSYKEEKCTQFTIIESSIIQENVRQQYTINEEIFAEQTTGPETAQEAMATHSTGFDVANATMTGPFREEFGEETETNTNTTVVETRQEETRLSEQSIQNIILTVENGNPQKTAANTETVALVGNDAIRSENFQRGVYSQQNDQAQAFCIERDVVQPIGAPCSVQVETYNTGTATFIETEIIASELHHGQTQKNGSDTETVIESSSKQEAMSEDGFVIETQPYIGTNSVVTNVFQNLRQERPVIKEESPENHFKIHDTTYVAIDFVEAVVPVAAEGKVVAVQTRPIEENLSPVSPLTLQQTRPKELSNIEAISIVLTSSEETAQMQSFTIDDKTYTEEDVTRYMAGCESTVKDQNTSVTAQDENISPRTVQQSSKLPKALAIFSGSNNLLDVSETPTPSSIHEETSIAERDACPTPEEEHPYSSTVQSKQRDEFELFFDVCPRTAAATQVKDIQAEDRAPKDTHATEQLKVFLERQALIYQSAANKKEMDCESKGPPEITGAEPVAGISIPPPPTYPPPPLRHRTPVQSAKQPDARELLPYPDHPSSSPGPPTQSPISSTLPASSDQQRTREQPPSKPSNSWTMPAIPLALDHQKPQPQAQPQPESLAKILHEALTSSQAAPESPIPLPTNNKLSPAPQTVHELPTLHDAREEPNIIAMSAAEAYATAMFASGDFLGDDLGWRAGDGVMVEEEENVLPEVSIR